MKKVHTHLEVEANERDNKSEYTEDDIYSLAKSMDESDIGLLVGSWMKNNSIEKMKTVIIDTDGSRDVYSIKREAPTATEEFDIFDKLCEM